MADSLFIPIKGSDERVEVSLRELPEDATDVLDILKAELAPLDLWLKFAVAYFKQGKMDQFMMVMEEGTLPDLEQFYPDATKERIALLNTLAAYHILLANREPTKKEEHYQVATQTYNKADKIDIKEEMTWAGKGVLMLARNEIPRALGFFENALNINPKNVPSLLGKASILFNRKQYEDALNCYKAVLQAHPLSPAYVRLGVGLCYIKLNKLEEAKAAFQRTVDLDPTCADAYLGLALCEMNGPEANTAACVKRALHNLTQAYTHNPASSMVLNHLANHFFYRKDYKKAHDLALTAYHNTEVQSIRAESCYHIGRSFHARGDYENAYTYYYQATRHWPDYSLAQFGLGQMYIHKGETENAITCFERVHKQFPDNFETLKTLGSLYLSTNRPTRAFPHLKRATELRPEDEELWIEFAQLHTHQFAEQLTAYERARKILERRNQVVPAELWNNIGALRQVQGEHEKALQAYQSAISLSGHALESFHASNLTTTFNLARLYEDMCRYDEAEALYKGILQQLPNYIDCILRLSCIARARGQPHEASLRIKETFAIDKDNVDAWTMKANLHLAQGEWQQAQKTFERILQHIAKDDAYSLLALGNINYQAKFDKKEKEQRDKYVRRALEFYFRVLKLDHTNIYAANGVGIIFAEMGKKAEAKDIFAQVREAGADIPDVWVNLAHVSVSQGQYVNAIKMYQNCLRKFYHNKDPHVLLFLARAEFEAGKNEDAVKTLQKAIHVSPLNRSLWFNLALAQEKFALDPTVGLVMKSTNALQPYLRGLESAKQALSVFEWLASGTGPAPFGPTATGEESQVDGPSTLSQSGNLTASGEISTGGAAASSSSSSFSSSSSSATSSSAPSASSADNSNNATSGVVSQEKEKRDHIAQVAIKHVEYLQMSIPLTEQGIAGVAERERLAKQQEEDRKREDEQRLAEERRKEEERKAAEKTHQQELEEKARAVEREFLEKQAQELASRRVRDTTKDEEGGRKGKKGKKGRKRTADEEFVASDQDDALAAAGEEEEAELSAGESESDGGLFGSGDENEGGEKEKRKRRKKEPSGAAGEEGTPTADDKMEIEQLEAKATGGDRQARLKLLSRRKKAEKTDETKRERRKRKKDEAPEAEKPAGQEKATSGSDDEEVVHAKKKKKKEKKEKKHKKDKKEKKEKKRKMRELASTQEGAEGEAAPEKEATEEASKQDASASSSESDERPQEASPPAVAAASEEQPEGSKPEGASEIDKELDDLLA